MARLAEYSAKTTKIWEAPERVLEIFQESVWIRKYNFSEKHYDFTKFYKDCLAVCPELVEDVKLISYEENKQDGIKGLECNMVIIEEFATEAQTKHLIENYDEKFW